MMELALGRWASRRGWTRRGAHVDTAAGMDAGAAVDGDHRGIVDVDGYVHLVDGKVVCFERHMFDLSAGRDRETLSRVARGVDTDHVCVLLDLGDDTGNYISETRGIGSFPEPLRETIRKAAVLARG